MPVGRPKLPAEKRLTRIRAVRLTPAENLAIEQRAKAQGVPPSVYMHDAALRHWPKPSLADRDAAKQLSKIGGNLNQLLRAINQGYPLPASEVHAALAQVNGTIIRLVPMKGPRANR